MRGEVVTLNQEEKGKIKKERGEYAVSTAGPAICLNTARTIRDNKWLQDRLHV